MGAGPIDDRDQMRPILQTLRNPASQASQSRATAAGQPQNQSKSKVARRNHKRDRLMFYRTGRH